MSDPLRLRVLTHADLTFADSLRALAGWNQTLADWKRLLSMDPEGCFLAEWNGVPAGTATTTVYGSEVAWLGMVLVHPDYRRRGVGRALLEEGIEHCRKRGARCIKLDATPLGKAVYDNLGFKDEWTLTRWERGSDRAERSAIAPRIRDWVAADTEAIEAFDAIVFGASRGKLMPLLAAKSRSALVLESEPGRVGGYGLLRDGSRALYLGPVIVGSSEDGNQLIDALVERGNGEKIYWDIPDQNFAAMTRARQHGFVVQRRLTRMYRGENATLAKPLMQFAIAGPELG
jgi:ribosomal protein S18 acetylase RimI-like enzyme